MQVQIYPGLQDVFHLSPCLDPYRLDQTALPPDDDDRFLRPESPDYLIVLLWTTERGAAIELDMVLRRLSLRVVALALDETQNQSSAHLSPPQLTSDLSRAEATNDAAFHSITTRAEEQPQAHEPAGRDQSNLCLTSMSVTKQGPIAPKSTEQSIVTLSTSGPRTTGIEVSLWETGNVLVRALSPRPTRDSAA